MAVAAAAQVDRQRDDEAFSPRQREVLDAALELIMQAGDSLDHGVGGAQGKLLQGNTLQSGSVIATVC